MNTSINYCGFIDLVARAELEKLRAASEDQGLHLQDALPQPEAEATPLPHSDNKP